MAAVRLSGGSRAISRAFTRAGELELPVELVREQGGQRWYGVPSATRPGTVHTVRVDPAGGLHCGCEAAAYGRHICWHRARVAQVLAAPAVAPRMAPRQAVAFL